MLLHWVLLISLLFSAAKSTSPPKPQEDIVENPIYPKDLTKSEALAKFVQLAEDKKMNVSVVVSTTEKYGNGNIKEVVAMSFTFPTADNRDQVPITKTDFKQMEDFVKSATKESLSAHVQAMHENEGISLTNGPRGYVENTAREALLKQPEVSILDRIQSERNYAAMYTFLGGNGDKTRVFTSTMQVDVEDKGGDIKDEEIRVIKQMLPRVEMMYSGNDMCRMLSYVMSKNFPDSWQVASNVKGESSVRAKKWAKVKMLDQSYLIFTAD